LQIITVVLYSLHVVIKRQGNGYRIFFINFRVLNFYPVLYITT